MPISEVQIDRMNRINFIVIDFANNVVNTCDKRPPVNGLNVVIENALITKEADGKGIVIKGDEWQWEFSFDSNLLSDFKEYEVDEDYISHGYMTLFDTIFQIKRKYVKSGWIKKKHSKSVTVRMSHYTIIDRR